MRWNEAGRWVWSDIIAHEPLISAEDFQTAQARSPNKRPTRAGSVRSAARPRVPGGSSASARSTLASCCREMTVTSAPQRAALAVARPMPDVPPRMTTR
jgi:hypothetical protein